MPRKPKLRKIGNTSADTMEYAVNLVCNENLSVRAAADQCNIKFQTLARYVKKKQENPNAKMEPNYLHRQVFKPGQEKILTDYLLTCSKMAYGLTEEDTRKLAYELAIKNNLKVPLSWEQKKWLVKTGVGLLWQEIKNYPFANQRHVVCRA